MNRLKIMLAVVAIVGTSLTGAASADDRRGDSVQLLLQMLFPGPPAWRVDAVPRLRFIAPYDDDDDDDGWSRNNDDDDDDDGWSRNDDDD